jgi:hypothetical protein
VPVRQNVRGFEKLAMTKPAHSAVLAIRVDHAFTKRLLMQTTLNRRGDIGTVRFFSRFRNVISWNRRTHRVINGNGERKSGRVVANDVHRPDREVMAGEYSVEVNKGKPPLHSGSQPEVVVVIRSVPRYL